MKVFYSKNESELSGYIHVANNQMLNMLVDDNEADEIIVDGMLNQVPFSELPEYYNSLLRKLRIGGRIVIYFIDFDIVSMQFEKGDLGIKDMNALLFGEGALSAINESVVTNLIGTSLKIEKRDYNADCKGIVVGVRE